MAFSNKKTASSFVKLVAPNQPIKPKETVAMKVEVLDAGAAYGAHVGPFDRFGGDGEYLAVDAARQSA